MGWSYWYERWDRNDWQVDLMAPYMGDPTGDPSSANLFWLGAGFRDYENHVLRVFATLRF